MQRTRPTRPAPWRRLLMIWIFQLSTSFVSFVSVGFGSDVARRACRARVVMSAGTSVEDQSLKQRILEYLKATGDWVPLSTIVKVSKKWGATKKKDVNRCLYALKDQGLVELITTENANPQWKALAPGTGGLDKGGVDVDPTEKIMDYFRRTAGTESTSLAIAKAVIGKDGTASNVNRFLYSLKNKGQIELKKKDGKPYWKLAGVQGDQDAPKRQTHISQVDEELLEEVRKALEGQKKFRDLAASLKPAEPEDFHRKLEDVLDLVRSKANECLANGAKAATLELIGSAAYGVQINGSDRDYVLRLNEGESGRILPEDWNYFAEELNQSLKESFGKDACVVLGKIAIQVFAPGLPELQFVPSKGDFEYEKVPYSNLVAGTKSGFGRDKVHKNITVFFESYPGAKNAAVVAKALFIPAVADLNKEPWSLILTHILYREASRRKKRKASWDEDDWGGKDDWGGTDLFRLLIRDLGSWPTDPQASSVGMAARWAKNPENPNVLTALDTWADIARDLQGGKGPCSRHMRV